ncbi:MAG: PAS domain-containing protein [Byssovorax sp.]
MSTPTDPVNPRPRIATLNDVSRVALLAAVVDSSSDAIISKTLDGVVLTWNRAAEKIYGYTAEEILGSSVVRLTHPDRVHEIAEEIATLRDGGRVEPYETLRVRKDGKIISVSLTISPIHNSVGQVVGASSIGRDITERKQADELILAASQYSRSLIEASLDPLVTISPEGKITDVNEATVKITGVAREKLIGTDFSDYFTQPDKAREGYQQVFSKGSVTDYSLTIRHRDERLTNVLYNASVYKDVDGNVLGVFAAARDVTAQKTAEAQVAEQRTKELERLAELERFQKLTVGRELKMIELKKEVEDLKQQRSQRPGS